MFKFIKSLFIDKPKEEIKEEVKIEKYLVTYQCGCCGDRYEDEVSREVIKNDIIRFNGTLNQYLLETQIQDIMNRFQRIRLWDQHTSFCKNCDWDTLWTMVKTKSIK